MYPGNGQVTRLTVSGYTLLVTSYKLYFGYVQPITSHSYCKKFRLEINDGILNVRLYNGGPILKRII